jgi:hypothetical protein
MPATSHLARGLGRESSREVARFSCGLSLEPLAVSVGDDQTGQSVGIAELSIRPCAEGCRTNQVAYLADFARAGWERHR